MKRRLLAVLLVRCVMAEEMSMVVRPTSAARWEVGMKICAAKKSLFRSKYVLVEKSVLQLYTIT